MATIQVTSVSSEVDYPDGDGRPMAETPQHRKNMTYVIEAVDVWFERDPMVYVSGNMFEQMPNPSVCATNWRRCGGSYLPNRDRANAFSKASTKKWSPHITDSSTPRFLWK
jgi:hypothetical protein